MPDELEDKLKELSIKIAVETTYRGVTFGIAALLLEAMKRYGIDRVLDRMREALGKYYLPSNITEKEFFDKAFDEFIDILKKCSQKERKE